MRGAVRLSAALGGRVSRLIVDRSSQSLAYPALANSVSMMKMANGSRTFCSPVAEGPLAKSDLIDAYKEIGDEARKVMLETEKRMRSEVDEKASAGIDVDMCASMYGHQMAGYMAEFVPTRPDSVVNQIRDKVLLRRGISVDSANEAFETHKNDHEVQLTLTTMYQHKLDQTKINPDFTIDKYCAVTEDLKNSCVEWVKKLHANIDAKSDSYMTANMKMQTEQARMMVPSIAIFTAQYLVLRNWELLHEEKLVYDLLFSVWPQAQQVNAQMHQAMNDAHMMSYTPDEETVKKMQEMAGAAA